MAGIRAMKFEAARIYFLGDVFVAVAVVVLLFGRARRVSRERASERRSREGRRKGAPRSRVLARLAQIGELARSPAA